MARSELPPPAPRPIPPLKLGMLLVHQGAVTPVQLAAALEAQHKPVIGSDSSCRILPSCRSRSCCGPLPRKAAPLASGTRSEARAERALSARPECRARARPRAVRSRDGEAPREGRVRGARPRLALRALTELTGWVADPFIVADDALPELLSAYENGVEVRQSSGVLGVLTPYAAATRIAQVASAGRETRLAHARCDPYLWVRVETDPKWTT